jgi:hypothetical protein
MSLLVGPGIKRFKNISLIFGSDASSVIGDVDEIIIFSGFNQNVYLLIIGKFKGI